MTLSVLIPAYNVQEELSSCLDSVLLQPLPAGEVEVIVVDDGSTDSTPTLLQQYAAQYSSLRIVTQTNAGVSAARNRAMQMAEGDYITFVDADDCLAPGTLSRVLQTLAQSSTEVVVCQSFRGHDEHYRWAHIFEEAQRYAPLELLRRGYIRGSVCGVLFRRSLLQRSQLRFLEGVSLGEDCQFGFEALAHATDVSFFAIPLYQVVGRPTSASRVFTPQRIERQIADVKHIFEHIYSIENTVPVPAFVAYMRYMPMSCFVAHLLRTPGLGWRCLKTSGLAELCKQIQPPTELQFMADKMRMLRRSLLLFYLIARAKYTFQRLRHT